MRSRATALGVVLTVLSFLVLHPLCMTPVAGHEAHSSVEHCQHHTPEHDELLSAAPAPSVIHQDCADTPALTAPATAPSGQTHVFLAASEFSVPGRVLLLDIGISRT